MMERRIKAISVVAVFLCIAFSEVLSSKILMVPSQGKSHMISLNSIGQEMKTRGHEVYTVADDVYKGKEHTFGAVGLKVLYYRRQEGSLTLDSPEAQKLLTQMTMEENQDLYLLSNALFDSCRNMLEDDIFMQTVSSLNFDLAVVEALFIPCSHILPHVFKIPHVTFVPLYYRTALAGAVDLPSYQHTIITAPDTVSMGFFDRLKNTMAWIVFQREILSASWSLRNDNEAIRNDRRMANYFDNISTYMMSHEFKKVFLWFTRVTKIAPLLSDTSLMDKFRSKGQIGQNIYSYYDLVDETQLYILVNSDLTFDHPKPLFPNVISVEALSAVEGKPLSKELEALVQSAENGVIVVSFGGSLQHLPEYITTKMVNAFGKRKELFLMRFVGELKDTNFKIPSNVKFMSWLPQNDLLAHNKTKLFITHGGIYGLHEAVYQGVPMLCVPLFGDQPQNAKKLKVKGYGLSFRITNFTEEEILTKIEEIVSNPMYREKTQRAGQIMRHRPMTARQTAAFWIEHVLKFGGEHLKSSSVQLSWWQFYCMDTLGFLVLVITVAVYILFAAIRLTLKTICRLLSSNKHAKND